MDFWLVLFNFRLVFLVWLCLIFVYEPANFGIFGVVDRAYRVKSLYRFGKADSEGQ